jgi:hypothetical protein
MCVSQLLDFPRLRLCGEFIRHCGHKTTQCRNYHHHALLRRLLKASSKHHDKRVLPRQAANARYTKYSIHLQSTAPCNTINNAVALTHGRPRPVHGFTTAVKERPSASGLSPPALSKQCSRHTTSVVGHGCHRRCDRRKEK